MSGQEFWNGDRTIIHHMSHEEVTYRPSASAIKTKPPPAQRVEIEEEPVAPRTSAPAAADRRKMFCHCLPSQVTTTRDPLYGETITRVTYGNKTTLEVDYVDKYDLFAKLVTTSTDKLGRGSILFIPSEKQWWKVQNSKITPDGLELECILSDQTPSFS